MDPPPVVPFEVFQKMFEEYASSSSAPPGEASRARAGPGSDGHESRDSHSYTSLEAPTLNGNRIDGGADGADLDTAMNAVQHLAKEDRLFDSFLKMSLREKPVGRVSKPSSESVRSKYGMPPLPLNPFSDVTAIQTTLLFSTHSLTVSCRASHVLHVSSKPNFSFSPISD